MTKVLREYLARQAQRELLALAGTLDWDPDYDYKAERSRAHKQASSES